MLCHYGFPIKVELSDFIALNLYLQCIYMYSYANRAKLLVCIHTIQGSLGSTLQQIKTCTAHNLLLKCYNVQTLTASHERQIKEHTG